MKLAVICGEHNLAVLPELRAVMDGLFIETLAWSPGNDRSETEEIGELQKCLSYSSCTLAVLSGGDFYSLWFRYVLGYQQGSKVRLTFWLLDEKLEIPPWAADFVVLRGKEADFSKHFTELEQAWNEEAKVEMARQLIAENNVEVSTRAFVEAVLHGDRFLVAQFLEAGFDAALQDDAGVPLLNHAIRTRHYDLVSPLLDAGADINGLAHDRGTTPLMDSAAAGNEELTELFIQRGADLETISRDGQTAVTLAVGNGRDGAAVCLIRHGADADKTDLLGMSARKYAVLYNVEKVIQAIAEREAGG